MAAKEDVPATLIGKLYLRTDGQLYEIPITQELAALILAYLEAKSVLSETCDTSKTVDFE